MNKRILNISLFLMLASTSNVLAQQGIGTNTPHRSAALQIDSQNKGILIPRINLGYTESNNTITITSPTISNPVKGLLVYNQTGIANVPEGFYYFDGTKWNPISKSYLQSNDHTTITGNGTSSDPYKVNIKPATDYTNQKVLATNTNGQVVWVEQGANTDTQTKLTQGTNVSITPNPSNFSVGGVNNYTIDVPTASISTFGVVKPGAGLSIAENGTLKVDFPTDNNTTYTAGNGITLTGTEFSVPVTTSSSSVANGNVITNVVQTANGIEITKATIEITDTVTDIQKVEGQNYVTITSNPSTPIAGTDRTYTIGVEKATATEYGVVKPGAGLSIAENGTLKVDFPTDNNTTYTAGTGITLTGTQFNVPVNVSGGGNVITGVTASASGLDFSTSQIATTDTKTKVAVTGPITLAQNPAAFTENGENTYTLGLNVGIGLQINNGVLNATVVDTDTKTQVTGNGAISVTPNSLANNTTNTYTVSVGTANASNLGVVKGGGNVNIAADGTLSVNTSNTGIGKTLTGSGITVTAGSTVGTSTSLANSVLADVTLGIADDAVTSAKILDGTIATADLANSAVTTAKIADNAVTIEKLPTGATNTSFLRGDGTWVTPTDNNTTYIGSTSVVLNGTSFERQALTGDVTASANSNQLTISENAVTSAKIANGTIIAEDLADNAVTSIKINNNAVTTAKIADDAVTAAKINADVAGNGLVQNTNGALDVNVINGLKIENDAVKLGGDLTESTTISTTTANNLKITGLQTVAQSATDKIMVVSSDGTLKQAKAVMPKFFYAPAVYIPTHNTTTGVLLTGTQTVELYNEYKKQFEWQGATNNLTFATTGTNAYGQARSSNSVNLPFLANTDLEYFVTYYDATIFSNVQISTTGTMTYTVLPNVSITPRTFINVVFKVKD